MCQRIHPRPLISLTAPNYFKRSEYFFFLFFVFKVLYSVFLKKQRQMEFLIGLVTD